MTNPVNLNRFRKAKTRAGKEARAEENRIRFGRTKADKALAKSQGGKLKDHLDGHKLDTDE